MEPRGASPDQSLNHRIGTVFDSKPSLRMADQSGLDVKDMPWKVAYLEHSSALQEKSF